MPWAFPFLTFCQSDGIKLNCICWKSSGDCRQIAKPVGWIWRGLPRLICQKQTKKPLKLTVVHRAHKRGYFIFGTCPHARPLTVPTI